MAGLDGGKVGAYVNQSGVRRDKEINDGEQNDLSGNDGGATF